MVLMRNRRQTFAPDWRPSPRNGIVQRWKSTMTMTPPRLVHKRGDVSLVLFPHSDLRSAKTRPALVVEADNLQTGIAQVVVVMITSRLLRANHPSRVTVRRSTPEGRQSGLL